jgi:hypothetical protein
MDTIYLIECVRDYETVYKIGYTSGSASKRLDKLATGNDGSLRLLKEHKTNHSQTVERSLHRFYKHLNINREWFKLDLKDVENFLPLCEKIENNLNILKNSIEDFNI